MEDWVYMVVRFSQLAGVVAQHLLAAIRQTGQHQELVEQVWQAVSPDLLFTTQVVAEVVRIAERQAV